MGKLCKKQSNEAANVLRVRSIYKIPKAVRFLCTLGHAWTRCSSRPRLKACVHNLQFTSGQKDTWSQRYKRSQRCVKTTHHLKDTSGHKGHGHRDIYIPKLYISQRYILFVHKDTSQRYMWSNDITNDDLDSNGRAGNYASFVRRGWHGWKVCFDFLSDFSFEGHVIEYDGWVVPMLALFDHMYLWDVYIFVNK